MDKPPKLGELITEPQNRDAVHIAVAPVIAGHELRPGQRVGFIGNAFTVGSEAPVIIGVVDPYLLLPIKRGEQFYMFLFPSTITSLRHEWTHPEFEKEAELAKLEPTFLKLKKGPEEKWIKEYAESIGCTFEELMDAADNFINHGEYFVKGGDFEGMSTSKEFWEKYEIFTNQKVPQYSNFFSCSC